ncbi:LssY C-terminal domain-containing protein [Actinomyces minihominis]|uniref:LssY C-terminal domain-containing protein n=1 Tax=Actinomyces minihominis TaxID=2002838 RepID=UPI000C077334|nr:LssY C-terminal domain-containing protein [Actinomyces minihominis]
MSANNGADDIATRTRRDRLVTFVNTFFFLFAGVASLWLVVLAALDTRGWRWLIALYVVLLWAVLAYVFLPRLYKLMTAVFLPDYFIGRTRTGSGLLGDVVNMAWDGPDANVHRVMQAAGWTLSTPVTLSSSLKIIRSVLTHTPYKDAPVSPLYLFDRVQDFAYQKDVGGSANQRHHVRFWKTPDHWPLPGGVEVGWLAAAAYDTGVRLSMFTLQVTHAISGDIDRERDFTIQSVEGVDQRIEVEWINKFSTAFHARNGGGDMVHTDGNLPIVNVTTLPDTVPQLTPDEVAKIRSADPAPPQTYWQKFRQTKRPFTLYLVLVASILTAITTVLGMVHGGSLGPVASVVYLAALALSVPSLWFGSAWARRILMVIYGVNVLIHVVAWFQAGFVVDSSTGISHIALATLLVLALSSEAVTDYAAEISGWVADQRRAKRRAKA